MTRCMSVSISSCEWDVCGVKITDMKDQLEYPTLPSAKYFGLDIGPRRRRVAQRAGYLPAQRLSQLHAAMMART